MNPNSSVLFDGNIPTLAGLDENTWASQLMILQDPIIRLFYSALNRLSFDFSATPNYSGVERVEVVMFNCPMWGSSGYFEIETRNYHSDALVVPTISSCNSLLKICIPFETASSVINLRFYFSGVYRWVHIAEVSFYNNISPCPQSFTIIPGNWTAPINEGNCHEGMLGPKCYDDPN